MPLQCWAKKKKTLQKVSFCKGAAVDEEEGASVPGKHLLCSRDSRDSSLLTSPGCSSLAGSTTQWPPLSCKDVWPAQRNPCALLQVCHFCPCGSTKFLTACPFSVPCLPSRPGSQWDWHSFLLSKQTSHHCKSLLRDLKNHSAAFSHTDHAKGWCTNFSLIPAPGFIFIPGKPG